MAWNNLTLELQNIYLQEFSYFSKWFFFIVLIGLAVFYLTVIWKNHKPTNSFMIAIRRIFFYGISLSTILASPFLFIGLSPEYSFWDFYLLPLTLYGIVLSIVIIAFFIDILRFGIPILFKISGLDWKDSNVNEIYQSLKKNKHLLKLK